MSREARDLAFVSVAIFLVVATALATAMVGAHSSKKPAPVVVERPPTVYLLWLVEGKPLVPGRFVWGVYSSAELREAAKRDAAEEVADGTSRWSEEEMPLDGFTEVKRREWGTVISHKRAK